MATMSRESVMEHGHFAELISRPDRIRNVCILAHVDHGKTTLADALIASNGIISDRMIGKMRYMDNLPEEQERGITMKSSSISLLYNNQEKFNLINLVDSPGHVDFCGEVSTATRICDGALIVIDAVEGVCPQTRTLLRHAWSENLKPLLVFNKIDRLILELKLDPQEIYKHLRQILEHVNAIAGECFNSRMMQMDEEKQPGTSGNSNIENNVDELLMEHEILDEDRLYFNPCLGNVIFASAIDGWAFRVDDFAKIWCQKASISEKVLKKTLWGDYYIDEKSKRVKIGAENKGKKPLFVKMIMENIWSIYDSLSSKNDRSLAQKLIANFKLQISNRDLNHRDPKVLIRSLLQQWLPLSAAVLSAICSELPASNEISLEKIRSLFDSTKTSRDLRESSSQIIKTGSTSRDSPVVIFVSKLFAVEKQQIAASSLNSRNAESANFRVGYRNGALTDEEVEKLRQRVMDMKSVRFESEVEMKSIDEIDMQSSQNVDANRFVLLAFARIYSGNLTAGQNLYVLDESANVGGSEKESFVVESIYSMMGREFLPVQKTYAGNIVALSGGKLIDRLTGEVAALTSQIDFSPFADLHFYAEPIVRVVVQPKNASDLHKMSDVLKLLSKIDPMIRTYVEQTGEHILATAGEMHLQKCIDDLTKRYSQLELNFSEPIVPFAETIVKDEKTPGGVKKKKNVEMWTANKQVSVNVRAAPLPLSVIEILNNNDSLLDQIDHVQQNPEALSFNDAQQFLFDLAKFYNELKIAFDNEGKKWKNAHSCIWYFGSRKARCNILFNKIPEYENRPNFWQFLCQKIKTCSKMEHKLNLDFAVSNSIIDQTIRECDQSFINGFRSVCQAGPLCSEILYGVGFFVENWSQQENVTMENEENSSEIDQCGPLSGQLLTTVKEACKASFQAQNQRLMAAMYACTIRCTTEVLGKVYSVLNKRNGKVIGEEMNEGTNLFEISAVLPVIESFGFADEIRKKTSALASPQLVFSHWEVIGVDPFWVPTTQEELEHFGIKADTANRALKYMNIVRKRKGLEVDEQVVEFGTKQRTLIKK